MSPTASTKSNRKRFHPNGFVPLSRAEEGEKAWNLSICDCGAAKDFRASRCKKCFLAPRTSKDCRGCSRTLDIAAHFYRRKNGQFLGRCISCVSDEGRARRARGGHLPRKRSDVTRRTAAARVRRLKATDPAFRIEAALRVSIYHAVKNQRAKKSSRAAVLLGCSIEQFVCQIEKSFAPGMTWKNYGRGRGCWHLDHIRPVSSFDLRDPCQQAACFHHLNFQPLWWIDNIRKGAKYEEAIAA